MKHAGSRNLGIDGVFEMADKYRRRDGFIFAYRNIRFEGVAVEENRTDLFGPRKCPLRHFSHMTPAIFLWRGLSFSVRG
jgi:hypothetical protein